MARAREMEAASAGNYHDATRTRKTPAATSTKESPLATATSNLVLTKRKAREGDLHTHLVLRNIFPRLRNTSWKR